MNHTSNAVRIPRTHFQAIALTLSQSVLDLRPRSLTMGRDPDNSPRERVALCAAAEGATAPETLRQKDRAGRWETLESGLRF